MKTYADIPQDVRDALILVYNEARNTLDWAGANRVDAAIAEIENALKGADEEEEDADYTVEPDTLPVF